MKRTLCFLCAALMLLLCACGNEQPPELSESPTPPVSQSPAQSSPTPSQPAAPTQEPSPEPTEEPTPLPSEEPAEEPTQAPEPEPEAPYTNPLTGLPMENDLENSKPIAIMLNNIKAAQPQQGNSQADIIYEVLAEGGITRMLGVYQDISGLGIVGSVRSARPYYFELALGHDAIFVHAGGSEVFYQKKSEWGLSTVDGVNGYYAYASTGLFWRDRERVEGHYYGYEHSLITSGEKLTTILTNRNVLGPHQDGYTYTMSFAPNATPVNGTAVTAVTVPFSGYKSTTFRYDEESGLYLVEQFDGAYIDGNDGSQVAVTNLLVLKAACNLLPDGVHLSIDLTSGEGWFSCGGKIIPITWEKNDRDNQLRYYDQDGQPLTLGQGKSYVCIIPLSRTITVE